MADILESLMTGPVVDVYPLALPDGEGLPAAPGVQRKLASVVVRGPDHLLSQDGTARVARFWLRLQPGMSAAFPLGMLGEIGLEAVG